MVDHSRIRTFHHRGADCNAVEGIPWNALVLSPGERRERADEDVGACLDRAKGRGNYAQFGPVSARGFKRAWQHPPFGVQWHGQTESVNEERCGLDGWGIPVSDAAGPSPARARPRLRWNQSRAVLSATRTLFRAFNEPVLACVFHVEIERARAASARHPTRSAPSTMLSFRASGSVLQTTFVR